MGTAHGKVDGNLTFPEFLYQWVFQVSWEVTSLWFWMQAAPSAAALELI